MNWLSPLQPTALERSLSYTERTKPGKVRKVRLKNTPKQIHTDLPARVLEFVREHPGCDDVDVSDAFTEVGFDKVKSTLWNLKNKDRATSEGKRGMKRYFAR